MDEQWKITHREQDQVKLNVDGTIREVTVLTFWIGNHGPFQREFPRGTPAFDLERAITTKREELQRRDAL